MQAERKLWAVLGNSQRLDGGAMFGNVPRAVWERWARPDERHRIALATRAMLIREDTGRLLLFDAGVGAFFCPDLRDRYGVDEDRHVLLDSVAAAGFSAAEIDVVCLSHLHFDHAGGVLEAWRRGDDRRLCFPNATFVVSRAAWERARRPHARDRASFVAELPGLLEASGRLEIVTGDCSEIMGCDYHLHYSDGHTPGLMLTEVASDDGPVVFAADVIPGQHWVHLPITMGYDRFPELLIDEKAALLTDLQGRGGRLFFSHDPEVAMARIVRDNRGRFTVGETWAGPVGLPLC